MERFDDATDATQHPHAPDPHRHAGGGTLDVERFRRELVEGVRAIAGDGGVENVFDPHLDGEEGRAEG